MKKLTMFIGVNAASAAILLGGLYTYPSYLALIAGISLALFSISFHWLPEPKKAKVNKNTWLFGTYDNSPRVTIDEYVILGKNARILTHCPINPGPVHIKTGCYIGYGAIIMPNVTLGEGTIVGAGSVVTRSTNPMEIVVGNPGRVIGMRSEENYERQAYCMDLNIPFSTIREV